MLPYAEFYVGKVPLPRIVWEYVISNQISQG